MKGRKRFAVLLVLMFVFAVAAPAASQPHPRVIAGVATLASPDCTPDPHVMPLTGVNDGSGTVWIFTRPVSAGIYCAGVLVGLPLTFVDNWNPAAGGCLMGFVPLSTAQLCIDPVPTGLSTVDVSLCPDPSPCWEGTATLVRESL